MNQKLLQQVNRYMFNKKESIVVPTDNREDQSFSTQYEQVKTIAVMLCNLHELGYTIPRDEIPMLMNMSADELNDVVYKPLLEEAKQAKGAHVEHKILFKGFPDSVRALDVQTLSDIRFVSYWTTAIDSLMGQDALTDGSITRTFVSDVMENAMKVANQGAEPSKAFQLSRLLSDEVFYKKAPEMIREAMTHSKQKFKEQEPRAIHVVDDKAYLDMVKNMLSARTSLSPYDKEIVLFTVDNFKQDEYMPAKIQFRETQAMLDKYNFQKGNLENINIRSMQDFERLLVALSDGDLSMSKKQTVRNFSNQERKALYSIFKNALDKNYPVMLESAADRQTLRTCKNILKDRLHFNNMGDKKLYNEFIAKAEKHEKVMGIYERNMRDCKYDVAAKVLSRYSPTLMIQHTREILGKACQYVDMVEKHVKTPQVKSEHRQMLRTIESCISASAKRADVKTLLSLMNEAVKDHDPYKIVTPKNKNDLMVKPNKSVELTTSARTAIMMHVTNAIDFQYKNMEMQGKLNVKKGTKVYIDPNLDKCPIPTVGRNDIGKNRTLPTGTQVPVNEGPVLRTALYKKAKQNQFIDFTCGFLNKDFQLVGQVSWNNLKQTVGEHDIGYHSGDTMMCQNGCTEVIDVNLNEAKSKFKDARYIAFSAIMWNGTPLSSCDELFMTMATVDSKSMGKNEEGKTLNGLKGGDNSLFDPALVQFKFDITGDKSVAVPVLYDIVENKAIIMNVEMSRKLNSMESIAREPRHFDLPAGCECLEGYSTELAMKCFAAQRPTMASIGMMASMMSIGREAELVDSPEKADVIFSLDRAEFADEREIIEGVENPERVVVTAYDKDLITAEMIPDAKEIAERVEKTIEQNRASIKSSRLSHDDRSGHDDIGPTLE